MSEIEDRLRSALNARAELVRPEDLSLNPVYEPEEPEVGHWWQRPGSFLFVAAVAVIVIALPLLALAAAGPGDNDRDPSIANTPSGTPDMIDPVRPAGSHDEADVDGDGTDDAIDLVSTDAADGLAADRLDVALSSTGTTVSYDVGEVDGASIGATANVDGRRGQEVVLSLQPESVDLHRGVPVVLSLRDGDLEQILADDLAVADGTLTYWWVKDGELWWWRSQEPQPAGGDAPYPVDVTRFPAAATLEGEPEGTSCVTATMPQTLTDCDEAGQPPSTDGTDPVTPPTSDTWWDEAVAGMPAQWFTERSVDVDRWLDGDLDGDGNDDQFRITGNSGNTWLQVETGSASLTAPVPGANPSLEGVVRLDGWGAPVVVGHSMEGAAGTTHATWFAFVLDDGALVPLDLTTGGPSFSSERSNLTTDEGGHPTELTWRLDEDSLFSMDYLDRGEYEGPDGTDVWVYLVRVRSWYVDGSFLRATTLGQACVAPEVGDAFYACPEGLDFPG
jgi:hypothetical protein